MKHLLFAPSAKGYGETILGVRVARELHRAGDTCFFLVHESGVSLLADTPFGHMKISDHAAALLKITLVVLFQKLKPNSILLSDYFTTTLAFEKAGADPACLKQFGVPIGAIDTWDLRRSGTSIDVFGGERRPVKDWTNLLDYRLVPVPIAMPRDDTGASYYCCLPDPASLTRKIRKHIRRDLGIQDDDQALLFCTAGWQHSAFSNEHANRLGRQLPELIGAYLAMLGPKVHLIHVGPSAYPNPLGDCYHWLPPLPPDQFEKLLGSVDLLLAANASSTTISRALVSGIPSVVLMNSRSISSPEELRQQTGGEIPDEAADWVRKTAPIFPFYLWPLGYYEFLSPLLTDNEYCEVVPALEILDQARTVGCLGRLLFDSDVRMRHIDRQMRYVASLRQLPAGGTLVSSLARRQ